MSLAELRLADVRCLVEAELRLHPRFNLITGANGSGKTSLLEAVYLLGRGRSFRSRHTEQLIRHTAPQLRVFGRIRRDPVQGDSTIHDADATADETATDQNLVLADELASGPAHSIALSCSRTNGLAAQIDGSAMHSLAELSEAFPVQALDPGIHRLVEEGPVQRRRWLDWAVFHVEPNFVSHWQSYGRALRQRNAALKSGADATLWDGELVRLGDLLNSARVRLIEALQPYWTATLLTLDALPTSMGYYQGWTHPQNLAAMLAEDLPRDRERGSTLHGPHRFDVLLRVGGRAARDIVSRGQQKLLGAAMALAMARYIAQIVGRPPTLLLDDPAAELDAKHTQALMSAVGELGGQRIVTALRPEEASLRALGLPDRVFHVEHGEVKRL